MRRPRRSTMITAWEATTCPTFSRRRRCAGRYSTTCLSRLACEARVRQYCWIHDVDRPARREGEDLVEDVGELKLPLIARDIAEMWRADDVAHREADFRHRAADAAVAVDAERLAPQRVADSGLPFARLEPSDVLRNFARRGEDQRPGELRGRIRGRPRMHVGGQHDAQARAGVDVDVRIDAALADEL